MAKKPPPKPIFPVVHEFRAALDNFLHQACMLADAVRAIAKPEIIKNEGVLEILNERLADFGKARFGDDA